MQKKIDETENALDYLREYFVEDDKKETTIDRFGGLSFCQDQPKAATE